LFRHESVPSGPVPGPVSGVSDDDPELFREGESGPFGGWFNVHRSSYYIGLKNLNGISFEKSGMKNPVKVVHQSGKNVPKIPVIQLLPP
jgi:hypothetical protein